MGIYPPYQIPHTCDHNEINHKYLESKLATKFSRRFVIWREIFLFHIYRFLMKGSSPQFRRKSSLGRSVCGRDMFLPAVEKMLLLFFVWWQTARLGSHVLDRFSESFNICFREFCVQLEIIYLYNKKNDEQTR